MSRWVDDIATALENLGGIAHRRDIWAEVKRIRPGPHPATFVQTIQRTIQNYSSDSDGYKGTDLFYSVKGIGSGVWGLRRMLRETPLASDLSEADSDGGVAPRTLVHVYRVLRDTDLARRLKALHRHQCQLCGLSIRLRDGSGYAEAHHIQPLGRPHRGPDTAANILVLCPNHHVQLDYGAIPLDMLALRSAHGHRVGGEFLDYHNREIFGNRA